MEWIVVHFTQENVVEAVPVAWLHDDLCYWPPYSGKRLIHAVTVCEKPIFGSWPLFKVRKLGNGRTYSSLVKARAKTCTAEDTSDLLTSDPEGKRIRRKKKYLYDTDESQNTSANESSSDEDVYSTEFPTLPDSNNTKGDINKCMNPELPSCENKVNKVKRMGFNTNPEEKIIKKKKKSFISTNEAQNASFTETSSDYEVGHSANFSAVPDHTDANMCITSEPLGTTSAKKNDYW